MGLSYKRYYNGFANHKTRSVTVRLHKKNISGCWGVRSPRFVWDEENFAGSNPVIPTN